MAENGSSGSSSKTCYQRWVCTWKKSARLAQTQHAKSCLMGLKLNTEMHTEHTAWLVPHERAQQGALSCMFEAGGVREPLQARITAPNLHTPQQHWVRLLLPRQLLSISKSWQHCQHLQELLLLIQGEVHSARDCSSRTYSFWKIKINQLKQHLLCCSLGTAPHRHLQGHTWRAAAP